MSLQQLCSLLWHWFDPWPGNFHMLWLWPKKKEERESLLFFPIGGEPEKKGMKWKVKRPEVYPSFATIILCNLGDFI